MCFKVTKVLFILPLLGNMAKTEKYELLQSMIKGFFFRFNTQYISIYTWLQMMHSVTWTLNATLSE